MGCTANPRHTTAFEQLTLNQRVPGSSPGAPTITSIGVTERSGWPDDALKENNRSPAWCFPPLEKRFEFPLGCLKSFAPIQDSNEIPLLERGTNEDVRSRDHREQKMAHGHGWCRPECNDETEIKRVPHEFVE